MSFHTYKNQNPSIMLICAYSDKDCTKRIFKKSIFFAHTLQIIESKTNGKMETILENQNEDEIRQRRDFMKTFGKESRHNVISRKDNLVLSPDQPPRIEEDNEVSVKV